MGKVHFWLSSASRASHSGTQHRLSFLSLSAGHKELPSSQGGQTHSQGVNTDWVAASHLWAGHLMAATPVAGSAWGEVHKSWGTKLAIELCSEGSGALNLKKLQCLYRHGQQPILGGVSLCHCDPDLGNWATNSGLRKPGLLLRNYVLGVLWEYEESLFVGGSPLACPGVCVPTIMDLVVMTQSADFSALVVEGRSCVPGSREQCGSHSSVSWWCGAGTWDRHRGEPFLRMMKNDGI